MTTLIHYGWSNFHDEQYDLMSNKQLLPGRVITVRGFKYLVITENGMLETELSGRLLFGNENEALPKTGDWVLFLDYGSTGYIVEVMPRANALLRKDPATKTGHHVLACNVDYALIVQGLDRDFNLMRLDRYLVQIISCGIKPVVILNKSDLVEQPENLAREVHGLKRDCAVHICSTVSGHGIREISTAVLEKAKTYVLIGSSGAGKSSLLNALAGGELQRTGETSSFNEKGKHTTSTRDLFHLDNGSLIIDTPGMREFGLTAADADSSSTLFPAIAAFTDRCRFNDCKHMGESGCAVMAALNSGDLDETIYASYVKLIKEQRRFEINAEDKKRLARQAGKMAREAKNNKKKFKGG